MEMIKNVRNPPTIEQRRKFQLFKRYLQDATGTMREMSRVQKGQGEQLVCPPNGRTEAVHYRKFHNSYVRRLDCSTFGDVPPHLRLRRPTAFLQAFKENRPKKGTSHQVLYSWRIWK